MQNRNYYKSKKDGSFLIQNLISCKYHCWKADNAVCFKGKQINKKKRKEILR